jgi:hypothetical protein
MPATVNAADISKIIPKKKNISDMRSPFVLTESKPPAEIHWRFVSATWLIPGSRLSFVGGRFVRKRAPCS